PLRFALAEVQQRMGDAFEAIASYRAVLAADAADRAAIDALVELYQRESMWPDLVEAIDAAAALLGTGEERDELRFRAARVVEEQQSDPLGAVERYRQILDESPTHEGSREALEGLLRRDDTRDAAAGVLEPLYRAGGEYGRLIDVLEVRLAAERDPGERRAL